MQFGNAGILDVVRSHGITDDLRGDVVRRRTQTLSQSQNIVHIQVQELPSAQRQNLNSHVTYKFVRMNLI
jgi:hypothetical protein